MKEEIENEDIDELCKFITTYSRILLLKVDTAQIQKAIEQLKEQPDCWATLQKLSAFCNFIEHLKLVQHAEERKY